MKIFESELVDENIHSVDTFAWAMTGTLLQKTISLPAWASVLPDATDASAREQRFRLWLDSPLVDVRRFYAPFIRGALADWSGHPLYVGLDTTSVGNRLVIARTAIIYRGRAVPLAWQVFKRKSVMLAFNQYAGLVQYTAQLIPADATVILLGDRGFRDVRLMTLARQLDWHFRLRLGMWKEIIIPNASAGLPNPAMQGADLAIRVERNGIIYFSRSLGGQ